MDDKNKKRAGKIYQWCKVYGLTHQDAEEICQEFHLSQLQGQRLKQASKHFVIDQLRMRGFDVRAGMPSIHDARQELKADPSEWSNPVDSIRIREALKGYSLEERVIIVLTNVWGLTEREISFVLGISEWRTKEKIKLLKKEL